MPIMLGALYRALIEGHATEETARKAAEEVAAYETRLSAIEARLALLTWMVGTTITLQLLTIGGLLSLVWRLVPVK